MLNRVKGAAREAGQECTLKGDALDAVTAALASSAQAVIEAHPQDPPRAARS